MQTAEPPAADAQQFRCEQCGGVLLYEPSVTALRCKHCKAVAPPAMLAPRTAGPREIPIAHGMAMARRGLGLSVQAVECKDCGATIQLGPHERAGKCVYCASPTVVAAPPRGQIEPESLVPFLVPQERAIEGYKAWMKGLWFRPSDLSRMAKLEEVFGVYVPFWTFDADVHSEWTAERGWHYQETESYTEYENGEMVTKTRTVTKTRWEDASGWRDDSYDDVLVCASKGIPSELVERLSTFDTRRLVGYSPGYLVGWRAEAYVVELPDAWRVGQQKIAASQEQRCSGDVGGDTQRFLQVSTRFANETFKHVLLPVYVAAYRYNGKPFQVLVNGQTGEVVGKAPWSFWKIFFAVLAVIAVIAAVVAAYAYNQPRPRSSSPPTPAATRPAPAATQPGVPRRK